MILISLNQHRTFLCANRAGTVATVRIEITDVKTTNALTAASNKGHTKRFCPDVQCPHCDFFGHMNKEDCKHKHCINVQVTVDWLTILLSVSASHTIGVTELLKASDCGKFRKFADWEHAKETCDAIGAELLELKRATSLIQEPVALPIERRDYDTTLLRDASRVPIRRRHTHDPPLPVTTMDDDGEQRDLTFGDLEAYTS